MSQQSIQNKDERNKFLLKLIFLLLNICFETDRNSLNKFIAYCGRYITDKEFSLILRKTLGIIRNKNCQKFSCEDWLMLNLYDLYSFDH